MNEIPQKIVTNPQKRSHDVADRARYRYTDTPELAAGEAGCDISVVHPAAAARLTDRCGRAAVMSDG